MNKAVAFPGQGVQSVGMGLPVRGTGCWHLLEEASDILGYDLGRLLADGPEETLRQTNFAQPAVFVTCFALWRLYHEENPEPPAVFLGHSLGELTAFAASGAFSFADGVRLAAVRGELMGAAAGGMLAVLGMDLPVVEAICAQVQPQYWVQVANINAPAQIVVSGEIPGLRMVEELAKRHGAKRVVPLRVSGPFHSQLMAPAAEEFRAYLAAVPFCDITVPVMSNHTSELLFGAEQIRKELAEQLTSPVRFTDNVRALAHMGVDTLIEVSPTAVLGPMAKRTVSTLKITLASPGGM